MASAKWNSGLVWKMLPAGRITLSQGQHGGLRSGALGKGTARLALGRGRLKRWPAWPHARGKDGQLGRTLVTSVAASLRPSVATTLRQVWPRACYKSGRALAASRAARYCHELAVIFLPDVFLLQTFSLAASLILAIIKLFI